MTKLTPLPGYCLIEPIKEDSKSAGGVYLPDSVKDKPMKGRIVELSPIVPRDARDFAVLDQTEDKMGVGGSSWAGELKRIKKGSTVLYKKWTNQEVQHEGKEYLLVAFNELLAIIE